MKDYATIQQTLQKDGVSGTGGDITAITTPLPHPPMPQPRRPPVARPVGWEQVDVQV